MCLYSSALTPKMAMSLKIEKGKTSVSKAENEIIANRPHLTIFEDITAEKVRYFQYALSGTLLEVHAVVLPCSSREGFHQIDL